MQGAWCISPPLPQARLPTYPHLSPHPGRVRPHLQERWDYRSANISPGRVKAQAIWALIWRRTCRVQHPSEGAQLITTGPSTHMSRSMAAMLEAPRYKGNWTRHCPWWRLGQHTGAACCSWVVSVHRAGYVLPQGWVRNCSGGLLTHASPTLPEWKCIAHSETQHPHDVKPQQHSAKPKHQVAQCQLQSTCPITRGGRP